MLSHAGLIGASGVSAAVAGPSIFLESFEGAGTPSGWTTTNENNAGTVNYDATIPWAASLPGAGSQCLYIDNPTGTGWNNISASRAFTAQSRVYFRAYFYATAYSLEAWDTSQAQIFALLNSALDNCCRAVLMYGASGLYVRFIYYASGAESSSATVGLISLNTLYRIEMMYDASGSAGSHSVAWRLYAQSDEATPIANWSASSLTLNRGAVTSARCSALQAAVGGDRATCYFDLIAADSSAWIGAAI